MLEIFYLKYLQRNSKLVCTGKNQILKFWYFFSKIRPDKWNIESYPMILETKSNVSYWVFGLERNKTIFSNLDAMEYSKIF